MGDLTPEFRSQTWKHRVCFANSDSRHAESLFHHFSDENVTRFMDIEACKSTSEAGEIIRFHLRDSGCRWGLFDKRTAELVGTCGYHCWVRDDPAPSAEIGYDLGKAYWGKGLMTETLHAVIAFGFDAMALARIDAGADPRNRRSIRLLRRLRFAPESNLREGLQLFHLPKGNWSPNRAT